MANLEQTKKCSKCGEEKILVEFREKLGAKNGINSCCKQCESKDYQQRVIKRLMGGLCFYCGKNPKQRNRRFCRDCGDLLNRKSKYYRNKLTLEGRGFRCGDVITRERTLCEKCLKRDRTYESKKRKQFTADVGKYFNNTCYICGLKSFEYQLYDCHHVDPSQKDFSISSQWKKDWKEVLNELEKCIYICSNCHRRLHYGYLDKYVVSKDLVLISGKSGIKYREELQKWLTM